MSKDIFIDRFNTTAEEFLTELSENFPSIGFLSQFRTGFSFLKNINKNQPQHVFNVYVAAKYKQYILDQDEVFFLNENYDISGEQKDYWVNFIDSIRSIWKELSDENKAVVWKYFRVLVALNDKCLTA